MDDFIFCSMIFVTCVQSMLIIIILTSLLYRLKKSQRKCVLVIGDIGRSPRMQNHVLSLADSGYIVDFVGLKGAEPVKEIIGNSNIKLHYLADPPKNTKGIPGKFFLAYKAIHLTINVFFHLFWNLEKSSHILVQNPPTIPTLAVTWFVCCIKGSSLVIDWHNYGYTILALSMKSNINPLVKFAKWFEGFFGGLSHKNFCVTKAMQNDLKQRWNISASVLYDRPVERYKEVTNEQKHMLFAKLANEYPQLKGNRLQSSTSTNSKISDDYSVFTVQEDENSFSMRSDRPVLLISSTSWTEDEDFGVLLSALEEYEHRKKCDSALPKIICIITGKGPLKEFYQDLIQSKNLEHVTILTPWLFAEDYPLLIGSADLGVCLHTSSSGLDLPMKVVDMFSCGVPVCAIGFQCLDELVTDNVNGKIFGSHAQLADQLEGLLRGFPEDQETLKRFRDNLEYFQNSKWDTQWNAIAKPAFKTLVN